MMSDPFIHHTGVGITVYIRDVLSYRVAKLLWEDIAEKYEREIAMLRPQTAGICVHLVDRPDGIPVCVCPFDRCPYLDEDGVWCSLKDLLHRMQRGDEVVLWPPDESDVVLKDAPPDEGCPESPEPPAWPKTGLATMPCKIEEVAEEVTVPSVDEKEIVAQNDAGELVAIRTPPGTVSEPQAEDGSGIIAMPPAEPETKRHSGRSPPWEEKEDAPIALAKDSQDAVARYRAAFFGEGGRRTAAAIVGRWYTLKKKGLLAPEKPEKRGRGGGKNTSAGKPHPTVPINMFSSEMDRCIMAARDKDDALQLFRKQFPESKHKVETIYDRFRKLHTETRKDEGETDKPAPVRGAEPEKAPVPRRGQTVTVTDPKSNYYERQGTVGRVESDRACINIMSKDGRGVSAAIWLTFGRFRVKEASE